VQLVLLIVIEDYKALQVLCISKN